MAKKPKTKPPESAAKKPRPMWPVHLLLAVAFAASIYFVVKHTRRYVARQLEPAVAPKLVVRDQPRWMNDDLFNRIVDSLRPGTRRTSLDSELLVELTNVLRLEPWVKNVRHVRRLYVEGSGDLIEVDCEFRVPVALVESGGAYWMVDADGVKLPELFEANELAKVMLDDAGSLQLRIISGVATRPPKAGEVWTGDDLKAGLDLVKLLYNKPFTADIAMVDVSNFAGRKSRENPQIVLVTRKQTEIRWGRPINAPDFFVEVPAEQKLRHMQLVFERFGRVDAGRPWIDIRFDAITYPADAVVNAYPR